MSHNVFRKDTGKTSIPQVGKEKRKGRREGFYFSAGSIRIVNGRTTRVSSVRRGGERVKEMRGGMNKQTNGGTGNDVEKGSEEGWTIVHSFHL